MFLKKNPVAQVAFGYSGFVAGGYAAYIAKATRDFGDIDFFFHNHKSLLSALHSTFGLKVRCSHKPGYVEFKLPLETVSYNYVKLGSPIQVVDTFDFFLCKWYIDDPNLAPIYYNPTGKLHKLYDLKDPGAIGNSQKTYERMFKYLKRVRTAGYMAKLVTAMDRFLGHHSPFWVSHGWNPGPEYIPDPTMKKIQQEVTKLVGPPVRLSSQFTASSQLEEKANEALSSNPSQKKTAEPRNNDGRSKCFWCSAPTKEIDIGLLSSKKGNVCTNPSCGK